MRYSILILLLVSMSGCTIVRLPIKAAKVGVKTMVKGVKLAGKGVRAVVN